MPLKDLEQNESGHEYVFDIETGPINLADRIQFEPRFDPPGNIKDPAKIEVAIEKKRAAWLGKAALSPLTGQVLAVGIKHVGHDDEEILLGDEAEILKGFWGIVESHWPMWWIGHNIHDFDLPFLVRRSWKHNVAVPTPFWKDRRWDTGFVDTMKLWGCGVYGDRVSLDNLGKHLGVGQKNGSGKFFSELFESDPEAALAYLRNDLALTEAVWLKLKGAR